MELLLCFENFVDSPY